MLPGSSGFRWMPRKMAGIAMITIEASIVAIVMLSVVLDRAIHLYRPGRAPLAVAAAVPFTTIRRTLTQPTANHLLDGNYLFGYLICHGQTTGSSSSPSGGPGGAGVRSTM